MKVLINRSDAIGDLLLTLPVIKILKDHFQAEVGLLISPRTKELVKLFPHLIDHYWVIDKDDSFIKKFKQISIILNDFPVESYLYIGGDVTANFVCYLRRVSFRGGLKSKSSTFLTLNNGVRQRRSKAEMHESEYNLELLKPLDSFLDFSRYDYKNLSPSLNDIEETWNEFKKSIGEGPFVMIHPGMSGHTLNWPLENYANLIVELNKKFDNLKFVISYTPSDQKYLDALKNALPVNHDLPIFYFDGSKKGLEHYLKILSKMSLFIGPSTGNTHLANMLGIPQIGLYSPIKVQSAKRWGPLRQDNRVQIMSPMVECPISKSCLGNTCSHFECMTGIAIEQVLEKVEELLFF